MSPTRRDILAMIAAAPVAALLPSEAAAHTVPLPPVHLCGIAIVSAPMERVRHDPWIEFYADSDKAIVRVTNPEDSEVWTEHVSRDPTAISSIRVVTDLLQEDWEASTP